MLRYRAALPGLHKVPNMASNTKGRKPTPTTAPAVAPTATVAVPTTAAVPATTVQVPAVYCGVAYDDLTASQKRFATAKAPAALPRGLAPVALVLGKPYRVNSNKNAQWWALCLQALTTGGGSATPAAMVAAGACPKFVGYAVKSQWLVPAPASA